MNTLLHYRAWLNSTAALTSADEQAIDQIEKFVIHHPNCFERTCGIGHITASALVYRKKSKTVLLTLHRKLNKWLQLGGHCDGHHLVHQVALKEAREESGLLNLNLSELPKNMVQNLKHQAPLCFDVDIHLIPAHKNESDHLHYDIRFLVEASDTEAEQISHESLDLRWFTLDEARLVTSEDSMLRQFQRLEWMSQFQKEK